MRKAGEGSVVKYYQPCFRLDLSQCTFFRTSQWREIAGAEVQLWLTT